MTLNELRKERDPRTRYKLALDNWRSLVTNSNSYAGDLVTQFLADGAVTQLQNRLAMLRAFTRDFSTDPYKPLATGQIKYTSAGSTTLTNPTNYEQGDSTVGNAAVTVNHYSQPFHVSDSELNSGLRMENLVEANSKAFATTITKTVTAPITTANYSTLPALSSTAANFGYSSMQTLWGQLQKAGMKNAVLDGTYMCKLTNQPTYYQQVGSLSVSSAVKAFGWDGIYLNSDWSAAEAKTYGFACDPQALGVLAGLPLSPKSAGNVLSTNTETIPDVELSIQVYKWFSLATRSEWCSFDVMLGVTPLDTTAGVLVQTP